MHPFSEAAKRQEQSHFWPLAFLPLGSHYLIRSKRPGPVEPNSNRRSNSCIL